MGTVSSQISTPREVEQNVGWLGRTTESFGIVLLMCIMLPVAPLGVYELKGSTTLEKLSCLLATLGLMLMVASAVFGSALTFHDAHRIMIVGKSFSVLSIIIILVCVDIVEQSSR